MRLLDWHTVTLPAKFLLLFLFCSCGSEYTTVIRNDSSKDISAEFSGGTNDINSDPAYALLLDSCCRAIKTAGRLKITCQIKPGGEIWIGQDVKLFDFVPPLDWNTVTVETSDKKKTVITPWNIAFLTSQENRGSGCGDCGPPRLADVISIK